VIGTAITAVALCAEVVLAVKASVSLSAEVVAIFITSAVPFVKKVAESDARNVDTLLITVTPDTPEEYAVDKGDDGDGREVLALADAFCRPRA
jgi:hypothetical protein